MNTPKNDIYGAVILTVLNLRILIWYSCLYIRYNLPLPMILRYIEGTEVQRNLFLTWTLVGTGCLT